MPLTLHYFDILYMHMHIPTTCDDGLSAVCIVVLGCEELAGAEAASVTGTVSKQVIPQKHAWKYYNGLANFYNKETSMFIYTSIYVPRFLGICAFYRKRCAFYRKRCGLRFLWTALFLRICAFYRKRCGLRFLWTALSVDCAFCRKRSPQKVQGICAFCGYCFFGFAMDCWLL